MDRYLPKPAAKEAAGGISDMTLWRWERAGLFPKRRKIGPNRVAWLASEIAEWQRSRPVAAAPDREEEDEAKRP